MSHLPHVQIKGLCELHTMHSLSVSLPIAECTPKMRDYGEELGEARCIVVGSIKCRGRLDLSLEYSVMVDTLQ